MNADLPRLLRARANLARALNYAPDHETALAILEQLTKRQREITEIRKPSIGELQARLVAPLPRRKLLSAR